MLYSFFFFFFLAWFSGFAAYLHSCCLPLVCLLSWRDQLDLPISKCIGGHQVPVQQQMRIIEADRQFCLFVSNSFYLLLGSWLWKTRTPSKPCAQHASWLLYMRKNERLKYLIEMPRKGKHSQMENKFMPISLCCLFQISIWVNIFFTSILPVICLIPEWMLPAALLLRMLQPA